MRLLLLLLLALPPALRAQDSPEPLFRALFQAMQSGRDTGLRRYCINDAQFAQLVAEDYPPNIHITSAPGADTVSGVARMFGAYLPRLPYFPRSAWDSARWFDYGYSLLRDPHYHYPSLHGRLWCTVRGELTYLDVDGLWHNDRWLLFAIGSVTRDPDTTLQARRYLSAMYSEERVQVNDLRMEALPPPAAPPAPPPPKAAGRKPGQ